MEARSSAGDCAADTLINRTMVPDVPSEVDLLGFKPYVEAVAGFLMARQTRPPLTVSVEGEWGQGKSSFMAQLRTVLKGAGFPCIQFNAWRHDKADSLWSAFALGFIRQMRPTGYVKRVKAWFRLACMRFDWSEGRLDVLRIVARLVAITMAVLALPVLLVALLCLYGTGWLEILGKMKTSVMVTAGAVGLSGFTAALVRVLGAWRRAVKSLGNPLSFKLAQYVRHPDYESHVTFLETFREDFERIVGAYAGLAEKVFVFIDDVDRCDVPRAAELMQAINLMVSEESRLVFIIGMDREKVAAGLAVKYKDLIPYLYASAPTNSGGPRQAVGYGFGFMEKFIQVPFSVPRLTDMRQFIESFGGGTPAASPAAEPSQTIRNSEETLLRLGIGNDCQTLRRILAMVVEALDNNPRRIKQFVNLFRLRALIAHETDLLRPDGKYEDRDRVTLVQLAKVTAISLQWPLLLADLEEEPDLIRRLHDHAVYGVEFEPTDHAAQLWREEHGLMKLLRAGLEPAPSDPIDTALANTLGLAHVDFRKLRDVAPRVRTVQEATTEPSAEVANGRSGTPPTQKQRKERRSSTQVVTGVKMKRLAPSEHDDRTLR